MARQGNIDLDQVKLDPKDQEFVDQLNQASDRLKQAKIEHKSEHKLLRFYLDCLTIGLILGGLELLIMHLTGYLR